LRDRGRDASQRRLSLGNASSASAALARAPGQRVRHQRDDEEHADHHPVAQVVGSKASFGQSRK
jgi:hypothetical protein